MRRNKMIGYSKLENLRFIVQSLIVHLARRSKREYLQAAE